MIIICPESPTDSSAIRSILEEAFGQALEAELVDALRASCRGLLSLVAVRGDRVVGHILFSPVTATAGTGSIDGMGLGPMAVMPQYQRQGIGSQLVNAGLEKLREKACPFVVVLGHPEYYPRFGFLPASQLGLDCQWEGIPDNVFLARVLHEGALDGVSGVARYRDEFNQAL